MKNSQIIEWLLDPSDPSVRVQTLTQLLDQPIVDSSVTDTKKMIRDSSSVQNLLSLMHPEGYWLQRNPRSNLLYGKGVEYDAYATTHYVLSYLAELGMDKTHPDIAKASNRYLSLQQLDGDFFRHFSCLYALNIRTFLLLGYQQDSRLKKTMQLMVNTDRSDGGYLCDMHKGKYKTKPTKSCVRGSVKALLAFSYLPEYWSYPRCQHLINYFLSRNGLYKTSDTSSFVNSDMDHNSFPITWRANVYEILFTLGKMGYGSDPRLQHAWNVLDTKRDREGRYILDWTPSQCPWKIGKRNTPNKWVTLYCLLAHKYQTKTAH
ncbi:MAG: hypothetical protein KKC68_01195 [Candidatus Thermoplasmatota archaeon]|nr:hypothetical protein [Candidatus Thermoplasmatota archaeon]MBU1940366.1 hypothetical protein [Candidatus Thermoplasmatota archaeon]